MKSGEFWKNVIEQKKDVYMGSELEEITRPALYSALAVLACSEIRMFLSCG